MSFVDQDQVLQARQDQPGGSLASYMPAMVPSAPTPVYGTGIQMRESGLEVLNVQKVNRIAAQPTSGSSPSTFFSTAAQQFDIIVEADQLSGILKRFDLLFDITVSTAAVQLLPTFAWFRRLEIINNGTTIDIYNDQFELIIDTCFDLKKDYIDMWAKMHNCNTDLSAAAALPVGNYRFVLNLNTTLFAAMQPLMNSLVGRTTFRFQPADFAQLSLAGVVGNVVCNSINMIANLDYLSPYDTRTRKDLINSMPVLSSFVSPQRYMAVGSTAIVAGQPIQFQLTTVKGPVAGFYIVVNDNSATTGATIYNNVDIGENTTVSLLDGGGSEIEPPLANSYLRYDAAYEHGNQLFFNEANTFNVVPLHCVYADAADIAKGNMSGLYSLRGTEQVRIIPYATIAGTYSITVYILYYKVARQYNGQISIASP